MLLEQFSDLAYILPRYHPFRNVSVFVLARFLYFYRNSSSFSRFIQVNNMNLKH